MVSLWESWYSRRAWSSLEIRRPSRGAGVGRRVPASTGTGAERGLRDEAPRVVVAPGESGGAAEACWGCSISPVQATTVWFQGVAAEER